MSGSEIDPIAVEAGDLWERESWKDLVTALAALSFAVKEETEARKKIREASNTVKERLKLMVGQTLPLKGQYDWERRPIDGDRSIIVEPSDDNEWGVTRAILVADDYYVWGVSDSLDEVGLSRADSPSIFYAPITLLDYAGEAEIVESRAGRGLPPG